MTGRVDDGSSKAVAFVLRPPKGDVFTAKGIESLVGKSTSVQRLDGTRVDAPIIRARLDRDGSAILTVSVPGGIDRAPEEPTDG